jgi:hypothetical protein
MVSFINKINLVSSSLFEFLLSNQLIISLLVILVVAALLSKFFPSKDSDNDFIGQRKIIYLLPVFLAILPPSFIAGYNDKRYFSAFGLYLVLLILTLIHGKLRRCKFLKGSVIEAVSLSFVVLVLILFIRFNHSDTKRESNSIFVFDRSQLAVDEYKGVIPLVPNDKLILVEDGLDPFKFGALSGRLTLTLPVNINKNNFDLFLNQYRPDFLLTNNIEKYNNLTNSHSFSQVGNELYLINNVRD